MSNIIESVRAFILQCPLLANEQVNVNYIGKNMAFSVDPLPCIPIIQRYVDGGSKKQYRFALTSKELYDEDTRINIENSQFYEDFEQWLASDSNALYTKVDISGYTIPENNCFYTLGLLMDIRQFKEAWEAANNPSPASRTANGMHYFELKDAKVIVEKH